ncbi:DUF6507 family protein [Arthrobacter gengyunqii]|uniref:PE domain-containing protein n=1 Tax=Arthrobacter gengyunqii TaxID=2886940 RepID=A0ABS8GGW4_9MICC|nr:hypothetical protein [Arthrobacter gengyunqii]MCC3265891.1 hypothetical protein [Arthrobacter gengyunqii]
MKFDLHTTPGVPPSSANGGDGNFDVTPSVIASILTDVGAQAQAFNNLAGAVEAATAGICEAANAWPVADQMTGLNTYLLQRYLRIIGARTANNITAVTDVVTILISADQEMSATARSCAAQAAQASISDDPLADPNAPIRVGPGPAAVQ